MRAPRAVVVTGGTGALGRAVVRELLRAGARVAVPYRGVEAFTALAREANADDALLGRAADMADAEGAARFCDEAAAALGGLDGLAALAGGYAGAGPIEQAPAGEWAAMMQANLDTAWASCRAALPHLLRGGGSIVTVSSRLAQTGGPGAAAYAVAKAGVLALTRALAAENAGRGVRVNCVVPGVIDTPANRAAMPTADRARWAPPEAVARMVVFLLSPDSAPLTGGILPFDA